MISDPNTATRYFIHYCLPTQSLIVSLHHIVVFLFLVWLPGRDMFPCEEFFDLFARVLSRVSSCVL